MATSDNKTADTDEKIFIGKGEQTAWLSLALANRHGLVTGATGTGKTVSLQVMAEGLCARRRSGIRGRHQGRPVRHLRSRRGQGLHPSSAPSEMGLNYQPDQFSTVFWDVFGEQGHPVRATVTEMGPLLLARMLDLNDVQEGVLNVAFRVADEHGLPLLDMKDLRSLLDAIVPVAARRDRMPKKTAGPIRKAAQGYGNVSKATVGTIQRQLLVLENQGGTKFFGEPALALKDFMKTDSDGRGIVNILVADKLMESPRLYATFLLWLLAELFEQLPEVGDPEKPKLVFFFDEAHLLFDGAPKALVDKIEQVVRLIRSRVWVFTSSRRTRATSLRMCWPSWARAFSTHCGPTRQLSVKKAMKAAAQSFRPNPALDTGKLRLHELGTGEALVSFLEGNGTPIDGRALS